MNLDQIIEAVRAGKTVHWANTLYRVEAHCDDPGSWHILCTHNGHRIGLTWADGRTLNGRPDQFFVGD